MEKVEVKARIEKLRDEVGDLISDHGIMYRSALFAYLSAAEHCLHTAFQHYEEYLEGVE